MMRPPPRPTLFPYTTLFRSTGNLDEYLRLDRLKPNDAQVEWVAGQIGRASCRERVRVSMVDETSKEKTRAGSGSAAATSSAKAVFMTPAPPHPQYRPCV